MNDRQAQRSNGEGRDRCLQFALKCHKNKQDLWVPGGDGWICDQTSLVKCQWWNMGGGHRVFAPKFFQFCCRYEHFQNKMLGGSVSCLQTCPLHDMISIATRMMLLGQHKSPGPLLLTPRQWLSAGEKLWPLWLQRPSVVGHCLFFCLFFSIPSFLPPSSHHRNTKILLLACIYHALYTSCGRNF